MLFLFVQSSICFWFAYYNQYTWPDPLVLLVRRLKKYTKKNLFHLERNAECEKQWSKRKDKKKQ